MALSFVIMKDHLAWKASDLDQVFVSDHWITQGQVEHKHNQVVDFDQEVE